MGGSPAWLHAHVQGGVCLAPVPLEDGTSYVQCQVTPGSPSGSSAWVWRWHGCGHGERPSPRDLGCCLLTWQIFCEKLSTSSFLSCLSCESCSCSPRRLSLASDSTSCSSFICNSPRRGWGQWVAPGRASLCPSPMGLCSFPCPWLSRETAPSSQPCPQPPGRGARLPAGIVPRWRRSRSPQAGRFCSSGDARGLCPWCGGCGKYRRP